MDSPTSTNATEPASPERGSFGKNARLDEFGADAAADLRQRDARDCSSRRSHISRWRSAGYSDP